MLNKTLCVFYSDAPDWRESGWEPTVFPFGVNDGPQGPAAMLESEDPADFLEVSSL